MRWTTGVVDDQLAAARCGRSAAPVRDLQALGAPEVVDQPAAPSGIWRLEVDVAGDQDPVEERFEGQRDRGQDRGGIGLPAHHRVGEGADVGLDDVEAQAELGGRLPQARLDLVGEPLVLRPAWDQVEAAGEDRSVTSGLPSSVAQESTPPLKKVATRPDREAAASRDGALTSTSAAAGGPNGHCEDQDALQRLELGAGCGAAGR